VTIRVGVLDGPVTVTCDGIDRRASRRSDRIYALIGLLAWARGDGLSTGQLTDLLWQRPAEEVLRKTVQRARRLLDQPQAIINLRGAYMLNERVVSCDLWELEDEALVLLGCGNPHAIVQWARRAASARPPDGVSDRRLAERAQLLGAFNPPRQARDLLASRGGR